MKSCPFCAIIRRESPASIVHEDDQVIAIVPLHSVYAESCIVIPRIHIDHFCELPDELTSHIVLIAQKISRRMKEVYRPERIGMLVHGYGVAHAHLNIFPQNHPHDATSRKFAYLKEGKVCFGLDNIEVPTREKMDEIAANLQLRS